jgi:hypothetical protein
LQGVVGRASYTFHLSELHGGAAGKHDHNGHTIVNSKSRAPVLAAIHEIGQALDAVFLNSAQLGASPDDPPWEYATDMAEAVEGTPDAGETLLCDWLSSVRVTSNHLNLARALREPTISQGQADQIKKLVKSRELWARCYELFIAIRCSDKEVRRKMAAERHEFAQIGSTVVYSYWQPGDFDAVEGSIEQAFMRLGWLAR